MRCLDMMTFCINACRFEDGFSVSVDVAAALKGPGKGIAVTTEKYNKVYKFFRGDNEGAPQPAGQGGGGGKRKAIDTTGWTEKQIDRP